MKRSLPKLVVRRETIRALVSLELARAVGGNTATTETCKVMCSTAFVALPPNE
jgi:hypothetical protein